MTPDQWAGLITPDRILALHREGAARYGGDSTQRRTDVECVDGRIGSAVNAAAYCVEGDEDWGLILASYLLVYLAKDHCFVDGNKRVAWLAAIEIFKNLHVTINASPDDAYAFMLEVSEGSSTNASAVAVWFAERLEATEEPVN
ncbi:MAG: Fic family protein [Acidobacteria bacterium]|nr:Fic family protein [Acidobacteriota bacterium]